MAFIVTTAVAFLWHVLNEMKAIVYSWSQYGLAHKL